MAYSAGRVAQEVGQEAGKIARKSGKLRCRCGFARTQAFQHGWRGIFCRARSPGGRAGSRKNCGKKSDKLRCRCAFARTQAFQHGCLDMFTKRDTETEPQRLTETRTQIVFITASARPDVIMAPAWMLLIERMKNTDVVMASVSAFAMNAEGFTPRVVAAAFFSLDGSESAVRATQASPDGLGRERIFCAFTGRRSQ